MKSEQEIKEIRDLYAEEQEKILNKLSKLLKDQGQSELFKRLSARFDKAMRTVDVLNMVLDDENGSASLDDEIRVLRLIYRQNKEEDKG